MADDRDMSLALLRPSGLRLRLCQGGIALALFIGTLGIGNFFVPQQKALDRHALGQDFLAFYSAGTFAREGRFADLYNFDALRTFQQQVAREAQLEMTADTFG